MGDAQPNPLQQPNQPNPLQQPNPSNPLQQPNPPNPPNHPHRITWPQIFMQMTFIVQQRSCCLKMPTAALITKGTQILAIGYNGTFSKSKECNEYWLEYYSTCVVNRHIITFTEWLNTAEFKTLHKEWSVVNEIHAEINALKWISANDSADCCLYTVFSPCDGCAKAIIAHGIKKVVYRYIYKNGYKALETLTNASVECSQIIC